MNDKDIDFIKNKATYVFKNKVKFDEDMMRKSQIIGISYEDENYTIFEMKTPKGKLFVNVSKFGIFIAFKTLESAKGYARIFNTISTVVSENLEYTTLDDFINFKDIYSKTKFEFKINDTDLFKSNYDAMK